MFNLKFHLCEQNFQDNPTNPHSESCVPHRVDSPGTLQTRSRKKNVTDLVLTKPDRGLESLVSPVVNQQIANPYFIYFSVHVFQQLFWSQYSTNGVARYLFIQLFFSATSVLVISCGHWPIKILPIHLYFPCFILAFLTPTPSDSNLYQPFDF